MNALILTLFISGVILVMGILFFSWLVADCTFEEQDNTALLPFRDEDLVTALKEKSCTK